MRQYNLTLVLTEELGNKEAEAKKYLTEVVAKVKGKITKTNILGLRQLAYQIKSATKGWYVFLAVDLEETVIVELTKLVEADEKIIRYLLVRAG